MKKRIITAIVAAAFSCAAPAVNAAYISGAESGAVYVWKYSSGYEYTGTVNNGTYIYLCHNGGVVDGRILGVAVWRNGCPGGWFTARYVLAQISGAESGAVYVWSSSSGSGYKTIVNNGTTLTLDSAIVNGRIHGTTSSGISGWFTARYVN